MNLMCTNSQPYCMFHITVETCSYFNMIWCKVSCIMLFVVFSGIWRECTFINSFIGSGGEEGGHNPREGREVENSINQDKGKFFMCLLIIYSDLKLKFHRLCIESNIETVFY